MEETDKKETKDKNKDGDDIIAVFIFINA